MPGKHYPFDAPTTSGQQVRRCFGPYGFHRKPTLVGYGCAILEPFCPLARMSYSWAILLFSLKSNIKWLRIFAWECVNVCMVALITVYMNACVQCSLQGVYRLRSFFLHTYTHTCAHTQIHSVYIYIYIHIHCLYAYVVTLLAKPRYEWHVHVTFMRMYKVMYTYVCACVRMYVYTYIYSIPARGP